MNNNNNNISISVKSTCEGLPRKRMRRRSRGDDCPDARRCCKWCNKTTILLEDGGGRR